MDDPFSGREDIEFISIHVRNPRTHLVHGWPVYSDYEIVVLTNSTIFAKERSQVRRRFSEFVWLWKQLSRNSSLGLKLPSLPTQNRVFGRFSQRFIEERRNGLQEALAGLTRITAILADAVFHLFIQSDLTVKEMENFISGKDSRDLHDIIAPLAAEQPYRDSKGRRCTCHSTGDSGFSGSIQPDDINQDGRGLLDDVSNWVISQQNYASVMGNGWSSGYTCQTFARRARSSCHLPTCPESSHEHSTTIKRRTSLTHTVASVLPGGQLMVAPTERTFLVDSPKSGKKNGEPMDDSKPYEGDDETEIDLSDFDIIKDEPFVRVREWLNSQNEDSPGEDSSDEEGSSASKSPRDIRMRDYDVISVPCSVKPLNSVSSRSIGYHSECEGDVNKEQDEDKNSDFTVLHSSIGGLDWKDRDDLSSSCDSLHSAALFLTYDVVEMIELRYNNVV